METKTKKIELDIDTTNMPPDIKADLEGKAHPGAGRTPKALQLKKYEHVLNRLDDCIDDVMDQLIAMIFDPDPNIRLRVCEMLLKRYIPEKKIKEVVGADGGPVQVSQNVDVRAMVLSAVTVLDEMGMDEIRKVSENFKLTARKNENQP